MLAARCSRGERLLRAIVTVGLVSKHRSAWRCPRSPIDVMTNDELAPRSIGLQRRIALPDQLTQAINGRPVIDDEPTLDDALHRCSSEQHLRPC